MSTPIRNPLGPWTSPHNVMLKLSAYHVGNLRWLLRLARHGIIKNDDGSGLDTGDWLGELLWEIEQQMIDLKIEPQQNVRQDQQWPLEGFSGGPTTVETAVQRSLQAEGEVVTVHLNKEQSRIFRAILGATT